MATYKVTVEVQFEIIEHEVIVIANSANEAQETALRRVSEDTESNSCRSAEVSSMSAIRCECVEPPSYDPTTLVM